MPRIVHLLGDEQREPVQQVIDLDPVPSIAWTLDPFAPVAEEYRHLMETPIDPIESIDSTQQEEQQ